MFCVTWAQGIQYLGNWYFTSYKDDLGEMDLCYTFQRTGIESRQKTVKNESYYHFILEFPLFITIYKEVRSTLWCFILCYEMPMIDTFAAEHMFVLIFFISKAVVRWVFWFCFAFCLNIVCEICLTLYAHDLKSRLLGFWKETLSPLCDSYTAWQRLVGKKLESKQ